MIITIENLRTQIHDLRQHLLDRAIIAHAQSRKLSLISGDFPEHRGDFDHCPSPDCAEVRAALQRTDDEYHN